MLFYNVNIHRNLGEIWSGCERDAILNIMGAYVFLHMNKEIGIII